MTDATRDKKHVIVLGGGAWGTALANLMAGHGHDTTIWCREDSCAHDINEHHENKDFLPRIALNKNLKATSDTPDFVQADLALVVVPAQFTRATLSDFASAIPHGLPLVLCSKGIEQESLSFMAEVVKATVPHAVAYVLSGPSFAKDVAIGLPTAVTLAGPSVYLADQIAPLIAGETFRPYTSDDIIGAEIGGAVKNVLAIACGIVLGMELGQSAHAALIARGFAEMRRLGDALGAKPETLSGLCGLGDLVLTCSSTQSRNMSCGMALGQGQSMKEIMASRNAVTEGVATAPALAKMAQNHKIDMPICQAVADIVAGDIAPEDAVKRLLNRPLKVEGEA
ncbi:NAD(P)H-dependent glycerol-3-phosphate dehydrogenase [Litorimonas sp. RW-G-Af-16]|uniref:NAD(P)H-dependent glycerol-3-phosphate dehydrogenase n=1 Tax=Litorimonas sp. RW-G-Af-16 TaxID=3241168 RepID=UPI00390C65E9